jgi:hypothetical protein
MSSATRGPELERAIDEADHVSGSGQNGPGFLAQAAAFLLLNSRKASARERASVLQAAARGDLSDAMDAMLAWAISERRQADLLKGSHDLEPPPTRQAV